MATLTVNYTSKSGKPMVLTSVYENGAMTEAKLLIPFQANEGDKITVDLSAATVDKNGFVRGVRFPIDKNNLPPNIIILGGGDGDGATDPEDLFK